MKPFTVEPEPEDTLTNRPNRFEGKLLYRHQAGIKRGGTGKDGPKKKGVGQGMESLPERSECDKKYDGPLEGRNENVRGGCVLQDNCPKGEFHTKIRNEKRNRKEKEGGTTG